MSSATSTVLAELSRTPRRTSAPTAADVRRAIAAYAPPTPAGTNTMVHGVPQPAPGGISDLYDPPNTDRRLAFHFAKSVSRNTRCAGKIQHDGDPRKPT